MDKDKVVKLVQLALWWIKILKNVVQVKFKTVLLTNYHQVIKLFVWVVQSHKAWIKLKITRLF